ncbi:hypothetical protein EVAR_103159_1 [Eumeta japonica]|uniref:Uncharacterized protein n=1 Tax=Eumeta variegata TaxID=151549 RepID=A0A4C1YF19_EUMVA|nr:hypothetical protein EVAR_103159_1 [Eumeta japonica]
MPNTKNYHNLQNISISQHFSRPTTKSYNNTYLREQYEPRRRPKATTHIAYRLLSPSPPLPPAPHPIIARRLSFWADDTIHRRVPINIKFIFENVDASCGWESLMKSVTLGNVTMSHRTREGLPNALRLSHSNYDRRPDRPLRPEWFAGAGADVRPDRRLTCSPGQEGSGSRRCNLLSSLEGFNHRTAERPRGARAGPLRSGAADDLHRRRDDGSACPPRSGANGIVISRLARRRVRRPAPARVLRTLILFID